MKINILNYTEKQFDDEFLRQCKNDNDNFDFKWEGDYDIVTIDGNIAIINHMMTTNDFDMFEKELFKHQPTLAPYISYYREEPLKVLMFVELNNQSIEKDDVKVIIENFKE